MSFQILGLEPAPFIPLYGLTDAALTRRGVHRQTVSTPHSAPDRIGLRDADPGETVLLLNWQHQPADTPYRATHAIFVREGATQRHVATGMVPEALARRSLSVRAFNGDHWMVDADLVEGEQAGPLIEKLLARPDVAYLQVHFARRGCFAATVIRA